MRFLKYLSLLFFSCLSINCIAQQLVLKGNVYIHNSKYKTGKLQIVRNVQVRADFSAPTISDSEGYFELQFVGIKKGASIKLDVRKEELELVNARELKEVILGRLSPIKIYLAPKGQIHQERIRLYNISIAALTRRHNKIIAQLRGKNEERQAAIEALERKLNKAILDRYEAEQLLQEQLETTKRRLPEFAAELAAVNLDFASEMYQEAYAYFVAGEIEKAIDTLDEAILDKEAEDALRNLEIIKQSLLDLDTANIRYHQSLDTIIQTFRLKAQIHLQQLEKDSALHSYQNALFYLEESKDTNQVKFAQIYWDIADVYQNTNAYPEAIEYKLKYLNALKSAPLKNTSGLYFIYKEVSELFHVIGNIEQSLFYYRKYYDGVISIQPIDIHFTSSAKYKLQLLLDQYGEILLKRHQYKKALDIYKELQEFQPKNKGIKKRIRTLKRKI